MITIAIYNSKGGVGKTATAVNLSYLSSHNGKRTLLWDLDPQASATYYYRLKPKVKGGAKKLIDGDRDLEKFIKSTDYDNLDMIPGDFSERNLDILLDDMKKSKKRLKNIVKHFKQDYDILIIDPPPGFSLLSENIFLAADVILAPMIPTTLSVRSYRQILAYYERQGLNKSEILTFFTMADRRKKIHKETIAEYEKDKSFLKHIIPYSSYVEKMGIYCAPIFTFANSKAPSIAYKELWDEIKLRIGID